MTRSLKIRQSGTLTLRKILIDSRVASLYRRVFGLPFLGERIRFSMALEMLGQPARKRQRLLDAGCAWGMLLFELSKARRLHSFELFGVDLSVDSLRDAVRLAGVVNTDYFHPVAADVRFLPFADNSFNRALCAEVLEHVENDGLVLREFRRTLQRDGRLVVTVPNTNQKTSWVSTSSMVLFDHVREGYPPEDLRRLMERHGFSVLEQHMAGNLFGATAWEVSFRFLSLFKPLAARSIIEALTFPVFYAIAKLDLLAHDRAWSKWVLMEVSKPS